jgi:lipoprotein-anchoring transpeptidase ErfK/SrfK
MRSLAIIPAALIVAAITLCGAAPRARRHIVKKIPSPPPIDQQILRVQVLLDRAHFSPGQIDASKGNVTQLMLSVFQSQHNLTATGNRDDQTLQALEQNQQSVPTTISYAVVYDDMRGPFHPLPSDMDAQAKLPSLDYASPWDGLGEKFHCSPALLRRLNPNERSMKPGDQLVVPNVHRDIPQGAATISVSKASRIVQVLDSTGKPIANYPATIGSEHDPLAIGNWHVTKVEWNPVFYFNPELFWDAKPQDAKAVIKPGPRNPVGVVWIGLNLEHYGIHGTPDPSLIGHTFSHGCIRLTNWDATELAQMTSSGMPVIFKE